MNEEETPCNITITRTRGAICMGLNRNKQGGLNFITLGSMKKVVRRSWVALQMPGTVILQVNAIGQEQSNDLDFLGCKKRPIGDIEITGLHTG